MKSMLGLNFSKKSLRCLAGRPEFKVSDFMFQVGFLLEKELKCVNNFMEVQGMDT
jgi:hypothetical protein